MYIQEHRKGGGGDILDHRELNNSRSKDTDNNNPAIALFFFKYSVNYMLFNNL